MHGQRSWLSSLRPLRARALKRVNGSERRCFLWACFFPPQLLPPLASLTRNKRERWRKASKVEQESASGELYRPAERQTLSAHTDDSSFSLSLSLSHSLALIFVFPCVPYLMTLFVFFCLRCRLHLPACFPRSRAIEPRLWEHVLYTKGRERGRESSLGLLRILYAYL